MQQRKAKKRIKNTILHNPYYMATKKKTKKRVPVKKRVAGKRDKKKKVSNTYEVKAHRYGVTFNTGSPAFYDSPEQMAREIDEYFVYILGEVGERDVKVGKKIAREKYWIREPEPATITGLCLYLGFATLQSLDDYCKKGPKFAEIIKRGKTRVANRYERNLSGDKPTGSIFALKNMGWSDANFFADPDGEATVIGFQYIVPHKPKNSEE